MQDEVGIIYYRKLTATATRGDITDGDEIGTTGGFLNKSLDTYYAEEITSTTAMAAATGTYNISLSAPVRARTIEVTLTMDGTEYQGIDNGSGSIIGNWLPLAADAVNTVNYDTGAVVIKVNDAGIAAGSIVIKYHQNLAQWALSEVIH